MKLILSLGSLACFILSLLLILYAMSNPFDWVTLLEFAGAVTGAVCGGALGKMSKNV